MTNDEISAANCHQQLRGTLEDLASFERQIKYKEAVPFVHITAELYEQWDSYMRKINDRVRWFSETLSAEETVAMREFDDVMEAFWRKNLPDVPAIHERQGWKEIAEKASVLLGVLREREPPPPPERT
ncbi:MAG: hypothetical protein AAF654_11270 [Myxococcota bacterium]